MNIITNPKSVVHFCRSFLAGALLETTPPHIAEAIPSWISTIGLSEKKRSQAELGRFVLEDQRDPATVSRDLRDRRFNSRDLYWQAFGRAVRFNKPFPWEGKVDWVLSVDGVSWSRGAETQIEGGNRYGKDEAKARRKGKSVKKARKQAKDKAQKKAKKKARKRDSREPDKLSEKKGNQKKSFTFLLGTITTHRTVRISLPRITCDPKDFHRQVGRPPRHKTQPDLVVELLTEILKFLPENVRLIVLADEYFEGEKITKLAKERGFVFIAPASTNRCFADEDKPNESNGERLWDRGKELLKESCERLDLYRGGEKTVSYRRYSARRPGRKDRRTYWWHKEKRTVAKLGTVGFVASLKSPVYRPRRDFRKKTYKVLVCSDPDFPGERIVELFEMRWTTSETVFRSLKQDLGLTDYIGTCLEAMERFIDLVLLTFLYLEMNRWDLLDDPTVPKDIKRKAKFARIRGMQELVWIEVKEELWDMILRAPESQRIKRRLKQFWNHIGRIPNKRTCEAYGA